MGDGNVDARCSSEALPALKKAKHWNKQSTALVTLDRIPCEVALMQVSDEALSFEVQ